ncbi:OmpA family protein [Burkholderia pyrrocinia]|uniref:OmpA family protein n=1 Tax=Burkholderia pyrrocinia TaxID=60550 RepID=UPI001BCDBCB7|nr:OmpA family protein [Burkholderia pyrrocinia]QVN18983.1 OmpA family protein [Burkholderia pyrrocinia]
MKRTLMTGGMVAAMTVMVVASAPAFASISRDADALVPAARSVADPYSRGLAQGWLEIAARQDREVLVSHTYNDAAPKALQNAKHFIDGSVPFAQIYDTKHWPVGDRPDWTSALREIERVDERAAQSPCKGESAGRLAALTDEAWKEQDETHGTRWVHGWTQIESVQKLAQLVDRELDACRPVPPKSAPEPVVLSADALFAFDSADLTPEGEQVVTGLAERLKPLTHRIVKVTGYTDRMGGDRYNAALSWRRGQAVAQALIAAGIEAGNVQVWGMGSSNPVVDCPGPQSDSVIACLAPNRRVTVQSEDEASVPSHLTPAQMQQMQQLMLRLRVMGGYGPWD